MDEIPNNQLKLADIPPRGSAWSEIVRFAYTFDGYRHWGSRELCAEVAQKRCHQTLSDLRTCLFFELRKWNQLGTSPDDQAVAYIRNVVELIRLKVEEATWCD